MKLKTIVTACALTLALGTIIPSDTHGARWRRPFFNRRARVCRPTTNYTAPRGPVQAYAIERIFAAPFETTLGKDMGTIERELKSQTPQRQPKTTKPKPYDPSIESVLESILNSIEQMVGQRIEYLQKNQYNK